MDILAGAPPADGLPRKLRARVVTAPTLEQTTLG